MTAGSTVKRTGLKGVDTGQPLAVLEFRARVAERIKTAREMAGFTQAELAEQLGFSQERIAHWETTRGLPPLHHVWRVCRALGITPNALLNDE